MYDIVRMCAPIPPFFSADRYKPPFLIKKVYDTLWFGGWGSGIGCNGRNSEGRKMDGYRYFYFVSNVINDSLCQFMLSSKFWVSSGAETSRIA